MVFRIIIYLIVCFLFSSCIKDSFLKKKNSDINKVVITGKTDDLPAFKVLNVMNDTYLFGRSHKNLKKEFFSDSLHLVLDSINKPIFSQIITANKYFYEGHVFLIPGDTIHIKIKNGSMRFYGKNAVLNNFYSKMRMETPSYSKNPYRGNLMLYKKRVEDIYTKKVAFFDQYVEDNNIQSELFIKTFSSFLKHKYLHALIQPKNFKYGARDDYIGEPDGLIPIIQKESIENPEIIIDLGRYFGNISIDEFKDEMALDNNSFFKDNINPFVRYYFLDSKNPNYSKENFIAEKEFIQENFTGELENYAIARMIRDYHVKGFGKSIKTIEIIKSTIKEYQDKFTRPSYREYMEDIVEDLDSYDFQLSEAALNSEFININGDTLTLRKIFSRSTKRIKVIDFWTTWCPPCIQQIAKGKDFKDKLSVAHNVDWVYISPEKDYRNWVAANKKYNQTLNFYNSYYLLKGKRAALTRFFKVDQFPRYIVIDQRNRIVLNNAPSPLDEDVFEEIIESINAD